MFEENPNSVWSAGKLEYPFGGGINFQIEMKKLDLLLERLKKNGYPIKLMPKERWYGQGNNLLGVKEMLVLDPDGYLLRFQQSIGQKKKK